MQLPKPGEGREATILTTQGEVRIFWTTPKFKAWRRLQSLKATRDAYMLHLPARVSEASDQLTETAILSAQMQVFGLHPDLLDVDIPDGKPVEAAVLVESCGSADVLVAIANQVLEAGGLSDREKKASSSPPASSSTAAAPPATGTTTPESPSGGTEDAVPGA